MRHKHYGTTLMNGEEGHWCNDRSNSNCESLTLKASFRSKMYPLSTSQSFSEATMDSHAVRPHVSQSALSRTGSTMTLCAGPAKAMPSTVVLDAGKPRPLHVFRRRKSIPPWWCIRPRMCHQCLRDCIRSNRLAPPSSRADGWRSSRLPGAICGVCRSPILSSSMIVTVCTLSCSTIVVATLFGLRLRLRLRRAAATVGSGCVLIAYMRWVLENR